MKKLRTPHITKRFVVEDGERTEVMIFPKVNEDGSIVIELTDRSTVYGTRVIGGPKSLYLTLSPEDWSSVTEAVEEATRNHQIEVAKTANRIG